MYGSNEQGFDPSDVRLKKRKVEGCEEWSVCLNVAPSENVEAAVFFHFVLPTVGFVSSTRFTV